MDDAISAFAARHQFLLLVAAYLGSAAVSTMPPKDAQWSWPTLYGWFFDWIHLVINSRNDLPILPAPSRTLPAQPKQQ